MNNMLKRTSSPMSAAAAALPFSSLVSSLLSQDTGRWFDEDYWGGNNKNAPASVPVNIRETDKTYEVELIAPGLKKSDFKVSLDGNQLSVSFNHNETREEGGEKQGYIRQEFRQQSFTRSFTLDDTVDANGIGANYTDGVLHLSVPKREEAQRISRTVEVS